MNKSKILHLNSAFSIKELPKATDEIESIYIEGYASTVDVDRQGDAVPKSVWEKGMENYLKNPVILAYHDHDDPIGRMVEHRVDNKGLWIKARISAAAEQFNLIKDKVLTAFSIGFRVMDAEYNSAAEVFVIKELELVEISVVSVPANQNTLFDLSKAFDSPADYEKFKEQFAPKAESAKGLESTTEAKSTTQKEWNMNPDEIKQMLADAAKAAAEQATKSLLAQQKADAEAQQAQAQAQAELESRIKAQVEAQVKTVDTGAERLLAEVTKRLEEERAESKKALEGLEAAMKEKAVELAAVQASKMSFSDKSKGELSYEDKEKAVLLSRMTGKSIESTKFTRNLIEKFGAHLPSATWELEVSMNMENEVRRRLVVAPTLRGINMQTNVMTIPLNPEAGVATWVQNAGFGAVPAGVGLPGASAGGNATHALKEITLNAYKVATNEYVAFEEEEDALMAIMPVIRDAMVRRVARAVDRAMLRGAGAGADPVKGLATCDAASAVTLDISNNDKLTVTNLRAMRRDLGYFGLDPAEVIYIVSTDGYFDLLEDPNFMTMDKVGSVATILTGQIGTVGNSPVLVSAEFADKADAVVGAIAFAPSNFLVGNQRGLRVDTQDLVETQRRVLVASLRTGMTQVTRPLSGGVTLEGVSALRYIA